MLIDESIDRIIINKNFNLSSKLTHTLQSSHVRNCRGIKLIICAC